MGILSGFFLDDNSIYETYNIDGLVSKNEYHPHCTLFYFGEYEDEVKLKILKEMFDIEMNLATKTIVQEMEGEVTGLARFRVNSGSKEPVVALLDIPLIHEYRRIISRRLDDAGIEYDSQFTPHITLGYVSKGYNIKLPKVKKYQFAFDELVLCSSQERYVYKL